MSNPTTAPVRLLAGKGAELQASEHAEHVEAMLADRLGRELTVDERFSALASPLMALLSDRTVDYVRVALNHARLRIQFGMPSGRVIRSVVEEVRHD